MSLCDGGGVQANSGEVITAKTVGAHFLFWWASNCSSK
jgi:hypothetical protein